MADACSNKTALKANHVLVETCSHGTVFICLYDEGGHCFAIAPFPTETALRVADALMDAIEEIEGPVILQTAGNA